MCPENPEGTRVIVESINMGLGYNIINNLCSVYKYCPRREHAVNSSSSSDLATHASVNSRSSDPPNPESDVVFVSNSRAPSMGSRDRVGHTREAHMVRERSERPQ